MLVWEGVLTTIWTWRFLIKSTTLGRPWDIFFTGSEGRPRLLKKAWVPSGATMLNPRPTKSLTTARDFSLSGVVREKRMRPSRGTEEPAASWDLKNARGKLLSMPMTSPVERISGESRTSVPGKRSQGSTASLTETKGGTGTW